MTDVFEVLERGMAGPMERRRFIQFTGALAGAAAFCQVRGDLAQAASPLSGYPFTLGVASGDPAPRGAVLWTRLAPDPLVPDGGMPARRLPVAWRVAKDPGMRRVVGRGVALAVPELAHSVHIEVGGLDPRREYFFQFRYRDALSPVGRTITAPARWDHVRALAFAFASCQRWDEGYYSAYRRLAEEDIEFVVHLGDYLYEYGIVANGGFRNVPVPAQFRPNCETLERYRLQYGLYKSDPDLRRAHQKFPWIIAWDDHEVENDYAGLAPVGGEPNPAFTARRAAAYQAFYEHIPVRAAALPSGGMSRLYRRLRWGDLAQFNVVDERQYRSDQPCGDGEFPRCAESLDPAVTMLGERQENWLLNGLDRSDARWNVIAQQVMMGELDHDRGDHPPHLLARRLGRLPRRPAADHRPPRRGPRAQPGPDHRRLALHLRQRHQDRLLQPGLGHRGHRVRGHLDLLERRRAGVRALLRAHDRANPHIKFFDGDRRGYVRCLVDRRRWRTDLRMVTTVSRSNAPVYTFGSFEVEDGRPGAERV